LLGFDIILDENKKAYLLEVNQNPSLHTDTPADKKIKSALVRNIFKMVSGGLPNLFEDKL
jgi:D-alanine-D-alanine ligase-like ATP-grasp enzyme